MIDNIKKLYSQVEVKSEAHNAVAEATGVKPNTIKAHWLCDAGLWSVPYKHQDTVVRVLQNIVKNQ